MWMRPKKRSSDDFKHYEQDLIYVDNILTIGDDPTELLHNIHKYFGLKPCPLSDPDIYIGAKPKPISMENGVVVCSFSLQKYIQEAVKNTQQYFKQNIGDQWNITEISINPLPCSYEPPLDVLS